MEMRRRMPARRLFRPAHKKKLNIDSFHSFNHSHMPGACIVLVPLAFLKTRKGTSELDLRGDFPPGRDISCLFVFFSFPRESKVGCAMLPLPH